MSELAAREFVTLWMSELSARERINLEALSHFVAAVSREVHRRLEEEDGETDGEVDVACALLPNGRLLIDAQAESGGATPAWLDTLERRLGELALPPVRSLPVAFSFRASWGKSGREPSSTFRLPFARWAENWRGGSIETLILTAATRRGLWEGKLGESRNADSSAADTTPAGSCPVDTTSADSTPVDSFPAGSSPAGSSPTDSWPPIDSDPEVDPRSARNGPLDSTAAPGLNPVAWNPMSAAPSAIGESPSHPPKDADRSGFVPTLVRAWRRLAAWWGALFRPGSRSTSSGATDPSIRNGWSVSTEDEDRNAGGSDQDAGNDDSTASNEEKPLSLADWNERIAADPDNAELYRGRADFHREAEQFEAAVADYAQVLELLPTDHAALLARGSLLCLLGETQLGLADFNAVLEASPNHVPTLHNRGVLLVELEAYDAAIADFSTAIEHDPWNARLWIARGRAYALRKSFAQASRDFSSAIRLDPHDDEPYGLRAACARHVGDFPESARSAIEDYSRALAIAPGRAVYYLHRAEHYWSCDENDSALLDCDMALSLDPGMDAALGMRGAVAAALGRHDQAIEDCGKAIAAGISAASVHLTRADSLVELERFEEALDDADRAVELSPEMPGAWKARGLIRMRLGQADAALEDLNEAVRLAPEEPSLLCHRAAILRHRQKPASAIEDCTKALEFADDFFPALVIRAGCWEDLEDVERAAADYDRLVALSPDDASVWVERANFRLRVDDYERAERDFDAALERDAEHVAARFHRGQIRAARGDLDGAIEDLSAATRLDPEFAPAFARRANVWLLKRELEKADADYCEAERLAPEMASQLRLMRLVDESNLSRQDGKLELAIEQAREALEIDDEHPPALHSLAAALLAAEDYVEALAACDQLREQVESAPGVDLMRGQILVELGEYESAGEHFERALESLTDQSPPASRGAALAGRAFIRAGLGDNVRSVADFAEATRLAPENAWVHYLQGRVYHQAGQPDAAALCFRLALRVDRPELSSRQRDRVEAYLKRSRPTT